MLVTRLEAMRSSSEADDTIIAVTLTVMPIHVQVLRLLSYFHEFWIAMNKSNKSEGPAYSLSFCGVVVLEVSTMGAQ